MIVTFKSRAAGDVIMFGDVARRMLDIIGKPYTPQGIVTVEQLPAAIAALKQAIAEDKAQRAGRPQDEDEPEGLGAAAVSLTQRAVPLLELFEYSLKESQPVTWGT